MNNRIMQSRNFRRFWAGQSVSFLGSQVSQFALPLVAVIVLNATPAQMGLLIAVEATPALLVGPLAGVWIDRLPRRPLLITWDLIAAALISSIPVASAIDLLSMQWLYGVAACVGVLDAFGAAWHAFLPTIVPKEHLVDANGKLEASFATASVAGPGLAGVLVQTLTAPTALLADAISYFASAALLFSVRVAESASDRAKRLGIRREIAEGFRASFRHPIQRAITGLWGIQTLAGSMLGALYTIYLVRRLGVGPALLGLISTIGGAASVASSLAVGRMARQFGFGNTLTLGGVVFSLSPLLIAFASPEQGLTTSVVLLTGSAILGGGGSILVSVSLSSLRQAITEPSLLGRVSTSQREVFALLALAGGLIGGLLGEAVGVRGGVIVAAGFHLLIGAYIVSSPLRRVREIPQGPTESLRERDEHER